MFLGVWCAAAAAVGCLGVCVLFLIIIFRRCAFNAFDAFDAYDTGSFVTSEIWLWCDAGADAAAAVDI